MPIVKNREEIRNPLDFRDIFGSDTTPEDLVDQLNNANIGIAGWREILPEIDEVERGLRKSKLEEVVSGSEKKSLAAAVLGHALPSDLLDGAYNALNELYFSLPEADTDFDAIRNPGFTDPD